MSYWTEFKSRQHALECLDEIFPGLPDREAYADIAWFLTEKTEFEKVLLDVSKDLWNLFPTIQPGSNRLTRAIRQMATRYGFSSYSDNRSYSAHHLVYIDNIDGRTFVKNIKDKVLWKDSFGFGHGEFSHSYQWLAIGKKFGWETGTAQLYAGTAVRSRQDLPVFVLEGGELMERRVTLWQWLLDCVNEKSTAPPAGWTAAHTEHCRGCFSTSYRFANSVHSFVSKQSDWLIGYYANVRGEKLNAHRDKVVEEAKQFLRRVEPGLDNLSKNKQRELVQGFLKDGVSNNYNDGIAQRMGLDDHYRSKNMTTVDNGVVTASITWGNPLADLQKVEMEFHGKRQTFFKVPRIE